MKQLPVSSWGSKGWGEAQCQTPGISAHLPAWRGAVSLPPWGPQPSSPDGSSDMSEVAVEEAGTHPRVLSAEEVKRGAGFSHFTAGKLALCARSAPGFEAAAWQE